MGRPDAWIPKVEISKIHTPGRSYSVGSYLLARREGRNVEHAFLHLVWSLVWIAEDIEM